MPLDAALEAALRPRPRRAMVWPKKRGSSGRTRSGRGPGGAAGAAAGRDGAAVADAARAAAPTGEGAEGAEGAAGIEGAAGAARSTACGAGRGAELERAGDPATGRETAAARCVWRVGGPASASSNDAVAWPVCERLELREARLPLLLLVLPLWPALLPLLSLWLPLPLLLWVSQLSDLDAEDSSLPDELCLDVDSEEKGPAASDQKFWMPTSTMPGSGVPRRRWPGDMSRSSGREGALRRWPLPLLALKQGGGDPELAERLSRSAQTSR